MTQSNTNTPSTTVAGFDVIGAVIAGLQAKFKDVQHDVKTTAGMKLEKADRAELKGYRLQVEEKRVELKAPYLTAEREIDAHAAKLSEAIGELEKARDKRIKDEEQRKRDEKAADERAAQAVRDAAIAAERAAAAEREAKLQTELAEARAALAAAKPVEIPSIAEYCAPAGWDRVEPGFEIDPVTVGYSQVEPIISGPMTITATHTPNHVNVPAGVDSDLLDLLSESDHRAKHTKRPATGFVLPTANEIADALSVRAKRRTTIMHVSDVLEAIRTLQAD